MQRIQHSTAYGSLPAGSATGTVGYFTEGAPASGVPRTVLTADFMNNIQEEIVGAVLESGQTLDAANRKQLASAIGTIGQRQNVLINSGFDIWQRGTSIGAGASGIKYLADRWAIVSVGSTFAASQQAFSVGQTDVPGDPVYFHRVVVTHSVAAGNYTRVWQRIEDVRTFAGKQVTVAFYAKADASKSIAISLAQSFGTGGSASVGSIGVNKLAITSSWARYTATFTVPSVTGKTIGAGSFLQFSIWFEAGSDNNATTNTLGQQSGTFDISNVLIVQGGIAPAYASVPYVAELAACQRYCEKSFDLATAPAQNAGLTGAARCLQIVGASAATKWLQSISFKASKRITPTVTLYNPSAANAQARNVTGSADCSSTTVTAYENSMTISYTSASGSALGNEVAVHWLAEAEL